VRIGELSARSGVPVRMLRYYEEKGLLSPARGANGYREYDDGDVTRAGLVTSMIRSGLPTKLIVPLLGGGSDPSEVCEEVAALLRAEAERLDGRIACMTLSRRTIQDYLDRYAPDAEVRCGTRPSAASRS
jgi:DNA-binding transcriptional MerR regulator